MSINRYQLMIQIKKLYSIQYYYCCNKIIILWSEHNIEYYKIWWHASYLHCSRKRLGRRLLRASIPRPSPPPSTQPLPLLACARTPVQLRYIVVSHPTTRSGQRAAVRLAADSLSHAAEDARPMGAAPAPAPPRHMVIIATAERVFPGRVV